MRLCNPEPTFTEVEFTGKKSTPLIPERKKKKPDLLRATEMVKWKPGKAVTPCIILSRGRHFSLWLFKFALRFVQPYFLQKPGYQKPWENSKETRLAVGVRILAAHMVPGSWGSHTAALGPGGFSRLRECKAVRSNLARTATTTKTQRHSESLENFFANLFQSWCVSHVSMFVLCKVLKEESWSPSLHFREGSLKFSHRVVVVIF